MSWYHRIEGEQVGAILHHHGENPSARYRIEWRDGEAYIGVFNTMFESENSGELDIELDDPRYDEFNVVCFTILRVIEAGRRRYGDSLSIDYRDFPSSVTDADTGEVIYPMRSANEVVSSTRS